MAEPDDGDSRDEVEVPAARVVADAAAVSLDDGEVGPSVGRQDGVAQRRGTALECTGLRHATTSVAPIVASTPPARRQRAAAVSLGTMPPSKRPAASISSTVVGLEPVDDRVVDEDPGTSRHEHDPVGAQPDRERGRGLVGVDVERPLGEGGDDRDAAGRERLGHRRRRRRLRIADEPERADRRRAQPDLVAHQPDRVRADRAHSSALISASDARTTSSTAGVVTRLPSTNTGSIPRRSSSAVI